MDHDRYIELRHKPGPKRADVQLEMPVPQGRDKIWSAIRKHKGRWFSLLEIEAATHLGLWTIKDYLLALTNAGYLQRSQDEKTRGRHGKFAPWKWKLIRDVGIEGPRVRRNGEAVTRGASRDAIWQTIKILGSFTSRELVVAGSSSRVTLSDRGVKDYLGWLRRAGYIRNTSARNAEARYAFVKAMNTGPRAPRIIQSVKKLFDPNLNKVVLSAKEGA